MRVDHAITQRRKRVKILRNRGLTTRQIAGELSVSQPTVVRDLRAISDAESEAVLAALLGQPVRPRRKPRPVSDKARAEYGGNRWRRYRYYSDGTRSTLSDANWQRRHKARTLREYGYSLRQIAGQLGVSPATIMRDLRRKRW